MAEAGKLSKPRRLQCGVCGQSTTGRQWWNQDTGYGLCIACIEHWITTMMRVDHMTREEAEEDLERTFGQRGVHFDLPNSERLSP
jgi:hypothetical protein